MKVAVIMSTFNGERYLEEQIDSILNQEGVAVELFIRDDGSSDKTIDIIKKYCSRYSNIHLAVGKNIGYQKSFIKELKAAVGYEYYAFSDQDDLWEKEKLHRACKIISEQGDRKRPIVYYSNLNVSDENLNVYRTTKLERRKQSMESLFMRRSIAGCTMVFNKELWNCIYTVNITENMLRMGHDSFILTLCYAVNGAVICDSNAYIRYRQHLTNTSGATNGVLKRLKKEWNSFIKNKAAEPTIAKCILENWDEMISPEKRHSLELVAGSKIKLGYRLRILFSNKFTTGDLRLTCLGKLKMLFGFL
ncbi:MAG: glycosyltransferase [Ruminococcus flavefaciens]|nr:glycosyltransferase [Ruminococcus flavefaciens]